MEVEEEHASASKEASEMAGSPYSYTYQVAGYTREELRFRK